jgi:hypothetical protein
LPHGPCWRHWHHFVGRLGAVGGQRQSPCPRWPNRQRGREGEARPPSILTPSGRPGCAPVYSTCCTPGRPRCTPPSWAPGAALLPSPPRPLADQLHATGTTPPPPTTCSTSPSFGVRSAPQDVMFAAAAAAPAVPHVGVGREAPQHSTPPTTLFARLLTHPHAHPRHLCALLFCVHLGHWGAVC